VFFAYAVITHDKQTLFVDPSQVDDTVRDHLGNDVEMLSYDSFFDHLRTLATTVQLSKDSVSRFLSHESVHTSILTEYLADHFGNTS
jgi:hypothetical protein